MTWRREFDRRWRHDFPDTDPEVVPDVRARGWWERNDYVKIHREQVEYMFSLQDDLELLRCTQSRW